MITITIEQAEAQGLRQLTTPCDASEIWIVANVCADMRRGGIAHAVVLAPGGAEVWRSSSGFLVTKNEKGTKWPH
ncbi:MAG: hypothetical protein WCN98_07655 [Verrucomicrobiaceae bacterium]